MVLTVEQLVKGFELSITTSFIQQQVSEYVELVGDKNPIHTDAEFARQKGLFGAVVPGGLIEGTLVGIASSNFPFGAVLVEKTFKFKQPLFVGKEVILNLRIDDVSGDRTRKIIKLSAKASYNDVVYTEGTFTGFFQTALIPK